MANVIRKTLNCGFVLFLFLPLFIFAISPVREVSQSEKRKLAQFPKTELSSFSLRGFSKQFESYWNDHFGLRDKLVAFNGTLYREVFNKSFTKEVIQGKDGWLFFNYKSSVYDFLGMTAPTETTLRYWTTTLENREKWLLQHDIHYLVLPVPNKINIYSEYLPARYTFFRKGKNNTNLYRLFDYLEKNSNFSSIINLTPLYLKEKKNNQMYFKTDSHWTRQGAYLAYVEMIKKLNVWYPEIRVIPYTSLTHTKTQKKGDLANMMGTTPREQYKNVKIQNSCSGKMFKLPNHDPSTTKRHPQVTTCDKAELTAVVTYDSFGRFLFPYYAEHFRRVTYVSRYDTVWLKKFLQEEKPDVFIHQRTARKVGQILTDEWGLAEELE